MSIVRKRWVTLFMAASFGLFPLAGCSDDESGDGDGDTESGDGDGDGGLTGSGGNTASGGSSTGGRDGGGEGGLGGDSSTEPEPQSVTVGPRPYFLIDKMKDSALKDQLLACSDGPFESSSFSIGHRGAALQFPEHTKESYEAAARTGAGIIECDVTFTADKELVCRHSQCDLHTTTDILLHPDLAAKCTAPFAPADGDTPASANCCTSDITLAEFDTLCGKMDGANPAATTVEEYVLGTADFRTDLYSTCGTLVTHAESIELIGNLGAKFTPELKTPSVTMPFDGFSQEDFAQKLIDEYKDADVAPENVWPQSFLVDDVYYWIDEEPAFGKQAVFLDDVDTAADIPAAIDDFEEMAEKGVQIIAPPTWALVTLDGSDIVPSDYAKQAKETGFDLITWTLERSGPLSTGGGWYFQSITDEIDVDGDYFELLHVLAQDVGILGIFSDWPATVTYYANCMENDE